MAFGFEESTLIFSSISLVSSFWVTLIYIRNKELHQHPAEILAWISVFEIAMCHHSIALALDSNFTLYGHGPHEIFIALSFGTLDIEESRAISCAINQALFSAAVTLVLAYNMFVCVDLIITLRSPLIRGKSRMKYYHICSLIFVIVQITYNLFQNSRYSECLINGKIYYQELWNFGLLTAVFGMFFIFAFISLVYSWVKLTKDYTKVCPATRSYFQRHIIYIIVFSIVWCWALIDYWVWNSGWLNKAGIIMMCASGFILALIRNCEPLFYEKSKESLLFWKKAKKIINTKTYIEMHTDMWTIPISHIMQKCFRSQTTISILTGLYEAIRLSSLNSRSMNLNDFTISDYNEIAQHKISDKNLTLDLNGIKSSRFPYYIIAEYAPKVFHHLRVIDNINTEISLSALAPKNNKSTLFSVHKGQGGSGSLFIFTEDDTFVIKTITKTERKTLAKRLLQAYHRHILHHSDSLLCRIYGVYTLKISGLAPLELLLCQNLKKDHVVKFYDLKGSTHNRHANSIRKDFIGPYKDSDFLRESKTISMNPSIRNQILRAIYNDALLLMRHDIMDYSIFMQVLRKSQRKSYPDFYQMEWYSFSIIDFLSEYNYKKKFEYYLKLVQLGKKIKSASVMDPKKYFNRFFNFASEKLLNQNTSFLAQML
ncbi:unnamed protein product [Blepharisma stoltei]|uniref:PIPK domain-containing protein n=1 Tax=Blepharisma stoltei TaxID=1481888 RepID=A0AAU9J3V2_9CILI|nr:unnamed protein product [Blepharisma stoltei]